MTDFYRKHYSWMNDVQFECFEFLSDLFGGAHHLHGKIYESWKDGIYINCTCASNKFATFDYDYMTKAVFMAHERRIRFAIEPSGQGMLKLVASKRLDSGGMHERHPSIEQALDSFNNSRLSIHWNTRTGEQDEN